MSGELPTRIQLELVTPERLVARESVEALSIPGKSGYLGVLPGHAPLLSELKPGELTYTGTGVTRHAAVSGGFVEVLGDRVTVLADACERAEEIDVARAERARQSAEEQVKAANAGAASGAGGADAALAQAALDRAQNRLAVASRVESLAK
ncbi:MAG TPA: F0F1 ATP synthase subunit epsilon [Terriglobia bacterium]|nr:F0F1 ATP synthase subunit epsilon [Terriglobia bacterium]